MSYILGKKLGMTTIYDATKGAQNVTVLECVPNKVSLVRTKEKDGYDAVQLEVSKTRRRVTRREFRTAENTQVKVGDTITVSAFSVGDNVIVSGITKAKGFQGVMKRHGFSGSPATHGHKHDHRAPGSIGSAFPQHVFRGMRMAGRMGGVHATSRNLTVAFVDPEQNILAVVGAVPGVAGRIVAVASTT